MYFLSDDDEIIWLAKGIAKAINRTERQTIHLLETGQLPAAKIGGRWFSTKLKLHDRLISLLEPAAE